MTTTTAVPTPPARPRDPARRGSRPAASHAPPATRRAQARLGMLMVAPLVAVVAVFLLFPLANAVYYVFVDFNGIDVTPPWVGTANFTELAQDSDVWGAFKNNVIWIVLGTVAPLVIGLGYALLVWTVKRGSVLYRTALFLPYVLPQVAVGVVWSWIYDPTRGWLNRVLDAVGLGSLTRGWLGDPDTALYAVLGTAVWATSGFVFIIVLSALRNVDIELVEASMLDGANPAQRLRYVILPQIMPVFLMVTTITLIGGFSVFDIVFVMTGGGPAGATETLGTYAYSSAFQLNRISYGTTLALIITVMAIPFAVGLNRLQRRLSLEGTGA
ncbi:carbohydrate ABC transporter permease [Nocardioides sp. cx-173]|uniref:carbohydrate ABC transporter permease n=1 Tax=Nocardioides sp. cx-173 TaxID=2898796 RepID=UPI001E33F155|nr:sugar ABC transporter permease [Nocardioides sp. cx-173]MCD4523470.1 sugar ABC transporter permease [Nocardioides sp. cx-173]UGB42191.1 sugar ABC transporter permease [Nocardioides sp. cx-173]